MLRIVNDATDGAEDRSEGQRERQQDERKNSSGSHSGIIIQAVGAVYDRASRQQSNAEWNGLMCRNTYPHK